METDVASVGAFGVNSDDKKNIGWAANVANVFIISSCVSGGS